MTVLGPQSKLGLPSSPCCRIAGTEHTHTPPAQAPATDKARFWCTQRENDGSRETVEDKLPAITTCYLQKNVQRRTVARTHQHASAQEIDNENQRVIILVHEERGQTNGDLGFLAPAIR